MCWPIEAKRLYQSTSNVAQGWSWVRYGLVCILGSKGQRSRSQESYDKISIVSMNISLIIRLQICEPEPFGECVCGLGVDVHFARVPAGPSLSRQGVARPSSLSLLVI